jgi:uncharacterized protein (UPF0332 family)
VPDPSELIVTARRLLHASSPFPITDGTLRRAVSTAYYALFHKVLRTGADRFMGVGTQHSSGFKLLYRGFNHGQMKKVCEELDKATMSSSFQVKLGRTSISPGMRDFATAFVQLQKARHRADYDPSPPTPFSISDTNDLIDVADAAITKFDQTAADERADVLAMMLVNSRQ